METIFVMVVMNDLSETLAPLSGSYSANALVVKSTALGLDNP